MFGLVIPEIHVNETKEVNKQTHTHTTLATDTTGFSVHFQYILCYNIIFLTYCE